MQIIETKIFTIFLGPHEKIEEAERRLEDLGYRIIDVERVDKGGSTHCQQQWEIKAILPWRKVI